MPRRGLDSPVEARSYSESDTVHRRGSSEPLASIWSLDGVSWRPGPPWRGPRDPRSGGNTGAAFRKTARARWPLRDEARSQPSPGAGRSQRAGTLPRACAVDPPHPVQVWRLWVIPSCRDRAPHDRIIDSRHRPPDIECVDDSTSSTASGPRSVSRATPRIGTIDSRPSHRPCSPMQVKRRVVNSRWKSLRRRSTIAAAWRSGAGIALRPWTISSISRAECHTVKVEIVRHGRAAASASVAPG